QGRGPDRARSCGRVVQVDARPGQGTRAVPSGGERGGTHPRCAAAAAQRLGRAASERDRHRYAPEIAPPIARGRVGRSRNRAGVLRQRRRGDHGASGHGGDGPAVALDVPEPGRRPYAEAKAEHQGRATAADRRGGREAAQRRRAAREGVQRDLLPLVEGSTVSTKYGPIKTDHVLFIASGAFSLAKPSDLIPEL